jgi:2-haloacid dehalogenase
VTFDCFGTLINWRHGIATAAELIAPGRGAHLMNAYLGCEAAVLREAPALRYRQALAETLRRAAAGVHVEILDDDASVLGATIPYWPVFPDVRDALAALREEGWNLGLLTNCDRDIIAETQRRLRVPFDAVLTAEDVGAYKPAHNHFVVFERSFGVSKEYWVHVGQSYTHDIVPASHLGITRVWVNRHNAPGDPGLAQAVLPDLTQLKDTVRRLWTKATP